MAEGLSPAQVGMTAVKEKNRLDYAGELECDEADTRHWMHSWYDESERKREPRDSFVPVVSLSEARVSLGHCCAGAWTRTTGSWRFGRPAWARTTR